MKEGAEEMPIRSLNSKGERLRLGLLFVITLLGCVSWPLATPSPEPSPNPFQDRPTEHEIRGQVNQVVYELIMSRIGLPWRDGGTDDRGYDCSGLVWRVFTDAGVNLKRSSARKLWEELPEAQADERGEFGTLVFFKGLTHVGIVRDPWSFYHVSSRLGVTRSFYSDYWGERVIGFRKVPLRMARESER
jgi:murein DD-endopeptidase